jgi:hypothetical protein
MRVSAFTDPQQNHLAKQTEKAAHTNPLSAASRDLNEKNNGSTTLPADGSDVDGALSRSKGDSGPKGDREFEKSYARFPKRFLTTRA